jgi:hypothetical protein
VMPYFVTGRNPSGYGTFCIPCHSMREAMRIVELWVSKGATDLKVDRVKG